MFEKSAMLYLYVETPLHAGSGSSVGVVDLPIQRERVTHYPLVQSSGIKGKLRAKAYEWDEFVARKQQIKESYLQRGPQPDEDSQRFKRRCEKEARQEAAQEKGLEAVFGPESDRAEAHAGALSPGDARLLLFPVRSLIGVFAWTTSRNALARFRRDLEAARLAASVSWNLDELPDEGAAWTADDKSLVAGDSIVLEDFAFPARPHPEVSKIAGWLAANVFPPTDEYKYFREKALTNLVILPEDAFRDFTQFATEVVTRIRIDPETKTVAQGALWTEEHLPSDTVLYAPLHATAPRTDEGPESLQSARDVLAFVRALNLDRLQLGGDEMVGRGIVRVRFGGGEEL